MPNSDDEDLARKLHTSIEANDIEGVRNALDHGAIPVNHSRGSRIGSIATAIYSRCSTDLMNLLIERGAKVIGEEDTIGYDDLSFSLNPDGYMGLYQLSYDEEGNPLPSPLQGSTQPYIIEFLLNNSAVVVNDLSTLKQEIIDMIQKCKQGQFNDLNEDLWYIYGRRYSDEYYDATLLRINQRGIKSSLFHLAKNLVTKLVDNNIQLQAYVITYTDIKSNRIVGLYITLKNPSDPTKYVYDCQYHTTLNKVFDNKRYGITETVEAVKLVINRDRNSIISSEVQAKTIIIEQNGSYIERNTDLSEFGISLPIEYTFSTAYKIAELVWYMFRFEDCKEVNKAKIVDLIHQVIRYDIESYEILQGVNQCYECSGCLEENEKSIGVSGNLLEEQLLNLKHKTFAYMQECISYQFYKEGAVIGLFNSANTSDNLQTTNRQSLSYEICTKISENLSIQDCAKVVQTCKSVYETAKKQKGQKLQDLNIAGPSRR